MKQKFIYLLFAVLFVASCSKEHLGDIAPQETLSSNNQSGQASVKSIVQSLAETFESGSKTSYAAGSVIFLSGSWYLNEALVGTSSSDKKVGTKSIRVRDIGSVKMSFDVTSGASTVSVKHAVFGTDGSSTWQLWVSSNSGSTYTQVGSTITSSSTNLQTATFTVNQVGTLRFDIRKVSGGANRINIDDFVINSSDTAGAGGGSTDDNSNLLLGNPSNAQYSVLFPSNYLMDKTQYTISYNSANGTPNWVSWYVGSTSLGSTPRQDDFRADTSLPSGWYQVGSTSYSGSGFDRGHNCPSGDRTSSVAANSATFLMTNMIPQAPQNNQQTWANLESYTRTLVTAGNEVFVVMGSYGTGGTGSNGYFTTINNGNIKVPNRIWKVLVVIPNGSNDLSRITSSTRVIAVDTPNINTPNSDWKVYRTSVDAIEASTGYDIMTSVATTIQATLESRIDNL